MSLPPLVKVAEEGKIGRIGEKHGLRLPSAQINLRSASTSGSSHPQTPKVDFTSIVEKRATTVASPVSVEKNVAKAGVSESLMACKVNIHKVSVGDCSSAVASDKYGTSARWSAEWHGGDSAGSGSLKTRIKLFSGGRHKVANRRKRERIKSSSVRSKGDAIMVSSDEAEDQGALWSTRRLRERVSKVETVSLSSEDAEEKDNVWCPRRLRERVSKVEKTSVSSDEAGEPDEVWCPRRLRERSSKTEPASVSSDEAGGQDDVWCSSRLRARTSKVEAASVSSDEANTTPEDVSFSSANSRLRSSFASNRGRHSETSRESIGSKEDKIGTDASSFQNIDWQRAVAETVEESASQKDGGERQRLILKIRTNPVKHRHTEKYKSKHVEVCEKTDDNVKCLSPKREQVELISPYTRLKPTVAPLKIQLPPSAREELLVKYRSSKEEKIAPFEVKPIVLKIRAEKESSEKAKTKTLLESVEDRVFDIIGSPNLKETETDHERTKSEVLRTTHKECEVIHTDHLKVKAAKVDVDENTVSLISRTGEKNVEVAMEGEAACDIVSERQEVINTAPSIQTNHHIETLDNTLNLEDIHNHISFVDSLNASFDFQKPVQNSPLHCTSATLVPKEKPVISTVDLPISTSVNSVVKTSSVPLNSSAKSQSSPSSAHMCQHSLNTEAKSQNFFNPDTELPKSLSHKAKLISDKKSRDKPQCSPSFIANCKNSSESSGEPEDSLKSAVKPEDSMEAADEAEVFAVKPQNVPKSLAKPQDSIKLVGNPHDSLRSLTKPENTIESVAKPEESLKTVNKFEDSLKYESKLQEPLNPAANSQDSLKFKAKSEEPLICVAKPENLLQSASNTQDFPKYVSEIEDSLKSEVKPEDSQKFTNNLQAFDESVAKKSKDFQDSQNPPAKFQESEDPLKCVAKSQDPLKHLAKTKDPLQSAAKSQDFITSESKPNESMKSTAKPQGSPKSAFNPKDSNESKAKPEESLKFPSKLENPLKSVAESKDFLILKSDHERKTPDSLQLEAKSEDYLKSVTKPEDYHKSPGKTHDSMKYTACKSDDSLNLLQKSQDFPNSISKPQNNLTSITRFSQDSLEFIAESQNSQSVGTKSPDFTNDQSPLNNAVQPQISLISDAKENFVTEESKSNISQAVSPMNI